MPHPPRATARGDSGSAYATHGDDKGVIIERLRINQRHSPRVCQGFFAIKDGKYGSPPPPVARKTAPRARSSISEAVIFIRQLS